MTVGDRSGWRPGAAAATAEPARARPARRAGVRVVIDVRPLQDPERAPLTAIYLERAAGRARRRPGRGRVVLVPARGRPATTRPTRWPQPDGRRPAACCRRPGCCGRAPSPSDPLLLRGATRRRRLARRARRRGRHASTTRPPARCPSRRGIPVVAALLDLAPWAMPEAYQRGTAARFGQRLRARILRDAAAVLVPGAAAAIEARRLLHVQARPAPGRAARAASRRSGPRRCGAAREERTRLGLGARYAVYAGRYDARQDLPTLLEALAAGSAASSPSPDGVPARRRGRRGSASSARRPMTGPPCRGPRRRAGVADAARLRPGLPDERLAGLVAGARFVAPAGRSEIAGPRRAGGDRRGRAGRRASAVGDPARGRRPGRDPRGARRPGPPRDRDRARPGPTTTRTRRSSPPPASGARRSRTWADVARETRAGLGGGRPAGAAPLAAAAARTASLTRPAPRGCRGRRCLERRDLALLDRRLGALAGSPG